MCSLEFNLIYLSVYCTQIALINCQSIYIYIYVYDKYISFSDLNKSKKFEQPLTAAPLCSLFISCSLLVSSSYYMCGSCFGLQTLTADNISLEWTLHFTCKYFYFQGSWIVNEKFDWFCIFTALVLKSNHCSWLLEWNGQYLKL